MNKFSSVIFAALIVFLVVNNAQAQYAQRTQSIALNDANSLFEKGDYELSKEVYRDFIFQGKQQSKSLLAIAYTGLVASILESTGSEDAKVYIDELLKIKDDASISRELRAYSSYYLSYYYGKSDQHEREKEVLEQGISFLEKGENLFRSAQLDFLKAKILSKEGKKSEAIDLLSPAVKILSKNESNYYKINALVELGRTYRDVGRAEDSEKALLRAVELSKESGNNSLLELCYEHLGELYKVSGNYNKSISYYNQQLKLLEKEESLSEIGRVYNDIGAVYSFLGDGKSALEYYNRSLEYRKKAGISPDPVTLSNIALVYQSLGEYELARDLYMQSLEIFEKDDNKYWVPKILEFMGDLYIDWQQPEKGIPYARRAVNLSKQNEHVNLQASTNLILAKLLTELEEHSEALKYYKASYLSTKDARGPYLTNSLINLSTAYYNVKSDSAFIYSELAFREIEWLRGNVTGDHLQTEVFRYFATYFFKVASWYIDLYKNYDKAFEIIEKGKSRSLLDQIAASGSLESFVDESTSLKILQKSKEIDRLYREYESAGEEEEEKDLQNQINDAKLEYELIINEAHQRNPDFKKFSTPEIISLKEAKEKLDAKSAVVELATFDNILLALIFTKNDQKAIIQEISGSRYSRQFLSALVNDYRRAIQNNAEIDSLKAKSKELYKLLIEPLKANFPNIENIVFIPDVSLNYLPFEALLSPEGEYLIESFNVKYLPSVSLYKYIPEPHRDTNKELLAVAGSGFQNNDFSSELRSQQNFASLPSTITEVNSIASKFTKTTALINEDVSEAALKKIDLENYRYLHFATHGTVNEDDPSQSGLLLSKRNDLEGLFGEDGLLNSAEISLLNLKADLVVLSACNTGYGRNVVGEGLLGLQRAFLKAGSSSVIVSLWSVYDKSTALMMGDFYEKMNNYKDKELGLWSKAMIWMEFYKAPMFGYKEKALRDAKLAMIEHPYYDHPVHWASFVLIGK